MSEFLTIDALLINFIWRNGTKLEPGLRQERFALGKFCADHDTLCPAGYEKLGHRREFGQNGSPIIIEAKFDLALSVIGRIRIYDGVPAPQCRMGTEM